MKENISIPPPFNEPKQFNKKEEKEDSHFKSFPTIAEELEHIKNANDRCDAMLQEIIEGQKTTEGQESVEKLIDQCWDSLWAGEKIPDIIQECLKNISEEEKTKKLDLLIEILEALVVRKQELHEEAILKQEMPSEEKENSDLPDYNT